MGSREWSRVLVVRLSSMGDVARMLPALAALKACGRREVHVTVEDRFAGLLDLFPIVDRVIPYPRRSPGSPARHPVAWSRAFSRYVRALRAARYDLALDLHGIFRSAVVARLSGASVTAGYGRGFGKEGSRFLYHLPVRPGPDPHISRFERYAGTLTALGFPAPGRGFLTPALPPEAAGEVRSFLTRRGLGAGGYLFVFVGTSRAQACKRWPLPRFLELARLARQQLGIPTVLGWGPDEADLVRAVPEEAHLHVSPDWKLPALLGAVAGAAVFAGADTGATHLAALVGVPTVAILGATDPVLNRPFGDRHRIVYRPGITRACAVGSCEHSSCMGAITADEVLAAVLDLAEQTRLGEPHGL
jgi:ADP-heptose:LPS heptosyltransferase